MFPESFAIIGIIKLNYATKTNPGLKTFDLLPGTHFPGFQDVGSSEQLLTFSVRYTTEDGGS